MKKSSIPKIAIFYDWLNQWGGAERLLLDILKIYPQAQLFTSVYDPQKTAWLPKDFKITTTYLNKFKIFKTNSFLSALFQPIALEQFKFNNFDIVISLTSLQGKCLLTPPSTLHVCYCLTPNRYIYQSKNKLFILYKHIDYIYAQRPDHYLSISQTVSDRIQKHYHRPSTIVFPGIDLDTFKPSLITHHSSLISNYFLVVSRLVPHKKIAIAIQACLATNQHLKIIGTGRQLDFLKSMANGSPLIEFLGLVDQPTLINYYQNCQALIHPQEEDFGYTVIEAQACGKPVIAFNSGGATETIIDGQTGLFFNQQSTSSLVQAINEFSNIKYLATNCRKNACRFSSQQFMLDFKNSLNKLWSQKKNPPNSS